MTKEELKQEAEEWIKDHSGLIGSYTFVKYDYDSMQKSYFAGAESRERRISVLKQENDILRNRLSNIVNSEHHCMKDCAEKLKLLSEYVSDLYKLGYSAKKIAELVQTKIAGILGGIENDSTNC